MPDKCKKSLAAFFITWKSYFTCICKFHLFISFHIKSVNLKKCMKIELWKKKVFVSALYKLWIYKCNWEERDSHAHFILGTLCSISINILLYMRFLSNYKIPHEIYVGTAVNQISLLRFRLDKYLFHSEIDAYAIKPQCKRIF